MFRAERSESIGVNETNRYVAELLGLDWRGFFTSFLARQQELNALSDLQPARRRDQLAGMLGIERLDRAIQQIKEDSRAAERQAAFLDRQLTGKSVVEARVGELRKAISENARRIAQLEQAQQTAKTAFQTASEAFQHLQQQRADWLQGQARLEAAEKTAVELAGQLAALDEEAARLAVTKREVANLDKELGEFDRVRADLETLKRAKSRSELRHTLTKQHQDLRRQSEQLHHRLTEIGRKRDDIAQRLTKIPADVEQRLANRRRELEESRERYTRLREQKTTREAELKRLESQMASIAEFGPDSVCDRCLRPLGDSLPQIREHLAAEQKQVGDELLELERQREKLANEGTKLRELCRQLESDVKRRYELAVQHQ
ncbi:MAG: hypothetical protein AB1744_14085, partial [Candidatus Zixiibacteriota bacterium]